MKPLERASPSLGEQLLLCDLSVAFRLDGRYGHLRRQGPAAALGDIAHTLAERVAGGDFDQTPDHDLQAALQAAWADGVARAELKLADSFDAGLPPPATRWPGYAQTATRTLALLLDEARARRGKEGGPRPHTEEELSPAELPLHGRADRVETHNGFTEIVDLKTGWTLPDELKPSHRRQLLVYAFLWHATHGDWPASASIQRLDGSRLTFPVDPAEAEEAATELIAALNRYNSRIATRPAPADLASPTADTCRYCAYRVACGPFFAEASSEWGWYRRSVLGDVEEVTQGRAHARVDVAVLAGTIASQPRVSVINWPIDLAPSPGDRVAIVDAIPTPNEADLRLAWDSAIARWEEAGMGQPSDAFQDRFPSGEDGRSLPGALK